MHSSVLRRGIVCGLFGACLLNFGDSRARAEGWQQYKDVSQAGWSESQLDHAREYAGKIGTAAVMIVDHGNVVQAWGAVEHPYRSASMRKSLYDATIGAAHLAKPFDVDTTLSALGIDDIKPLDKIEKSATFEQLLTARSGVYHTAAYETPSNARRRPKRHSEKPGALWYYNNWDFNTLCAAFEKLSGESIATAFADRIVKPLGMEDFTSRHVFEIFEPRASQHTAVTFRTSARDLARIGKLYLQGGQWNGTEIVSSEWVKRSTEPHTIFEEGHYRGAGNGYGRLWWIFPARPERKSAYQAHHRVAARGSGGHLMVLFPKLDVLVVHRTDTDSGRGVGDRNGVKLLDLIMGARLGEPVADAAVGAMRVDKLSGRFATPVALRDDLTALSSSRLAALEADYMFTEQKGIRLYKHDHRLFARLLGLPLPDAELFEASDGSLRSPVVPVVIEVEAGAGGTVDSLRMTFRGETKTGRRVG